MPRLISSLLFLCVALVSETLAQIDGCYETDLDAKLFAAGTTTTIDKFPYQISLETHEIHTCSGSIISSEWVLTAAHCLLDVSESGTMNTVRAGTTTFQEGGSVHDVVQIVKHPNFSMFPTDYDIAVMRIRGSFTFSASVQPIRLATITPATGTVANVTGWNSITENGPQSNPLRVVSVPIWSEDNCKSAYDSLTPRMFCAGYRDEGKDACTFDTGGPLVADGEQVGVVSYGDSCRRPCKPGVYADVAYFRSWITSVTGV